MNTTRNLTTCALISAGILSTSYALAESLVDPKLDFRLRFEDVSQDNARGDAQALTLRTTFSVKTNDYSGWSAFVEFEDVRTAFGVDDYNNTNGLNTDLSVIADPETTEFDQGYVQYKNKEFTAKIGRQVITLDDHRFVGHVAWRQDKQTFDAVSASYTPNKDLKIFYAYLDKRNRIFGEEKDQDAKDHLFNISYKTGIGTVTGYSYLLETDVADNNGIDTYGVSFKGSRPVGDIILHYLAEYAKQSTQFEAIDFDSDFFRFEGGATFSKVTAKLGYELLGSDDGQFSFLTPLATLHKFNGFSDQFLNTPTIGLQDLYASVSGNAFGGKWLAVYHNFTADESVNSIDDFGDEINLQYTKKFDNGIYTGVKAAFYSAGDTELGKVDTDKIWLWVGKTF